MRVQSQFIEMFGNTSKEMLGKFIQVIRGVSYKPSDVKTADDPDTAVILRSNNINDANLNTDEVVYIDKNRVSGDQYLRINDIVVCASNGSKALVGKAAINKTLTNQYAHGAFCLLVRPNDNINPVYLNTFFQTSLYKKQIDELAAGSNILNIKQEHLTNMILPLPIIEEQNKFAIIAEQADKSKFVGFKSQFIEMFSSVGNYIEDSYPGEWGTEDKDGNGVKVVRTTNFTNSGKLDLTDVVTRSISEKKVERKTIRKYDTILERSGGTTDNPVGRVVLFEEDEQYLCNNFTQVLRFKKVDPIFAFYSLFYFYHTNKIVVRSMGSKTTGIQNLNMSKYLEIGIPNASDDEQKKFVAIAKQADKSKYYN